MIGTGRTEACACKRRRRSAYVLAWALAPVPTLCPSSLWRSANDQPCAFLFHPERSGARRSFRTRWASVICRALGPGQSAEDAGVAGHVNPRILYKLGCIRGTTTTPVRCGERARSAYLLYVGPPRALVDAYANSGQRARTRRPYNAER
jgi:hypothetical protein